MRIFIKSILLVSLTLFAINYQLLTVHASTHQQVGTNGAQSVEFELGVRPAGMGGAFSGVADDINALYWNPAGLSQVENVTINPAQVQHFENANFNYVGLVYPLDEMRSANIKDLGTLGFSISLFDLGEFIGRDETGDNINNFKCQDRIINISYGKSVTDRLSLGINGKFIAQEIESYKAEGYAFDVGGLYNTSIDNFSFGFCIQNLGNKIKFIEAENSLPLNIKLGFAYKMFNKNLILAMDINKPINNFYRINTGAEWWLANVLALRIGYKSRYDLGDGISAGAGLSIKQFDYSFMPVKEILFDYAFVPYGDLGYTHQVSLILKFGVD